MKPVRKYQAVLLPFLVLSSFRKSILVITSVFTFFISAVDISESANDDIAFQKNEACFIETNLEKNVKLITLHSEKKRFGLPVSERIPEGGFILLNSEFFSCSMGRSPPQFFPGNH
jgi:hypothetical protein